MTATARRTTLRRTATAVIGCCLALVASSCTEDTTADPQPLPPAESSASSSTPTPSKTATPKDPLKGYSTAEKEAFNAAVTTYTRVVALHTRLTHEGTAASVPAQNRLKSLSYNSIWRVYLASLEDFEESSVYTKGQGRLISTEPTRIVLGDGGAVSFDACVDTSRIRVFQRGTGEIKQPPSREPHLVKVVVSRFPDSPWKLSTITDAKKPC
jgi:hypothetical protein